MNSESRKMNPALPSDRAYETSSLPVFSDDRDIGAGREELRTLYDQICTSWRGLIEIRFKLLGFVPAVSILLIAGLLSDETPTKNLSISAKLLIAVLGLAATFALFIYDIRNSALHDDLISRGRKIEELWGIHTGQFRGRLVASNWLVKHDRATALIYGSALIGWIACMLMLTWRR